MGRWAEKVQCGAGFGGQFGRNLSNPPIFTPIPPHPPHIVLNTQAALSLASRAVLFIIGED